MATGFATLEGPKLGTHVAPIQLYVEKLKQIWCGDEYGAVSGWGGGFDE